MSNFPAFTEQGIFLAEQGVFRPEQGIHGTEWQYQSERFEIGRRETWRGDIR